MEVTAFMAHLSQWWFHMEVLVYYWGYLIQSLFEVLLLGVTPFMFHLRYCRLLLELTAFKITVGIYPIQGSFKVNTRDCYHSNFICSYIGVTPFRVHSSYHMRYMHSDLTGKKPAVWGVGKNIQQ